MHKSLFFQILYAVGLVISAAVAYGFPSDGLVPVEFWSIRAAFGFAALVFAIQLIREMRG